MDDAHKQAWLDLETSSLEDEEEARLLAIVVELDKKVFLRRKIAEEATAQNKELSPTELLIANALIAELHGAMFNLMLYTKFKREYMKAFDETLWLGSNVGGPKGILNASTVQRHLEPIFCAKCLSELEITANTSKYVHKDTGFTQCT